MANDALNPPEPAPVQPRLKGREIIVAVCGGIAAYKVADVVSKLVQHGAGVTVCMTAEAQKFITPLTFEALSGRPVRTVAVSDFSGLTSSACALAKAAANAATDSLDRGMRSHLIKDIKAYRARFRALGAHPMANGLLCVFRH